MANTAGQGFKRWDTAGGIFNEANPPRNPLVRSIICSNPTAAPLTVTLESSGVAFTSVEIPANDAHVINLGEGAYLQNLTATVIDAGAIVTVIYA